ncbi:MAG TPA: hypothetical protein VH144_03510 [Candidatus Saccharimonadales bacterium]|jgi:hypothetical protein|nr:hypothetical protein [Candidatus Saccharimonadales bacterium]
MSEHDDELFLGLEQDRYVDQVVDELTDRYATFVEQRGVDLSLPSPDSTRGNREFVEGAAEVHSLHSLLANLAVQRAILDVGAKVTVADNQAYLDHLAQTRYDIIKSMWLNNQWHEPWTDLVNQEFPGEGPSTADIESFIAQTGEKAESDLVIKEYIDERITQITTMLEQAGYDTSPSDLAILPPLIQAMYLIEKYQDNEVFVKHKGVLISDTRDKIMQLATDPMHPVWREILDQLAR